MILDFVSLIRRYYFTHYPRKYPQTIRDLFYLWISADTSIFVIFMRTKPDPTLKYERILKLYYTLKTKT